jgi:hypothetical protein
MFPNIYINLVYIYYTYHFADGKTIKFSSNVVVEKLQNPDMIVSSRRVGHSS